MKKRLIASALILTAIVIAPKVISIKLEKSLHTTVGEINSIPGYTANIQAFQSGWFSSTAKIEIGFDLLAMSPQATTEDFPFPTAGTIPVDFNASHGPLLFGAHSGIAWFAYTISYAGDGARDILSWADSSALYALNGNMGLLGASQFSDSIPAFKAKDDQAYDIHFSGYQGRGEYTRGEYTYAGGSEKLELSDSENNLGLADLNFDMSMQGNFFEALRGSTFDSEVYLGLKNLTFKDADGEQVFAIEDIGLGAVTSINKQANVASSVINYSVKSLDIMDYLSKDIVLQMELNNLSLEFIESYQNFNRELVTLQAEEFNDKIFVFLQNKLLPALQASPELNISEFSGTIPQGNFKGSLFTKISGIETLPNNMLDQAFWLQHLVANADIDLDKEVALFIVQQQLRSQLMQNPQAAEVSQEELEEVVAQQSPKLLNEILQLGFITETESGYSANFELKDGKAVLNGNPLTIPGM